MNTLATKVSIEGRFASWALIERTDFGLRFIQPKAVDLGTPIRNARLESLVVCTNSRSRIVSGGIAFFLARLLLFRVSMIVSLSSPFPAARDLRASLRSVKQVANEFSV